MLCADQHFSEAEDYTIILPNFVDTETVESNMAAFPNPVTNVLNLQNIEPNAVISVYDNTGKQILNQLNTNNQINTSSLKAGIYEFSIKSHKVESCKVKLLIIKHIDCLAKIKQAF